MLSPQEVEEQEQKRISALYEQYIDRKLVPCDGTIMIALSNLEFSYGDYGEVTDPIHQVALDQILEKYRQNGWIVEKTHSYLKFRDARLPPVEPKTGIMGYLYRYWGYE